MTAALLAGSAGCGTGAVSIAAPTPQSNSAAEACAPLRSQLPSILDGLHSRVVRPFSTLTYAWGSPPVRLRCGVAAPAGATSGSLRTTTVGGVHWYYQPVPGYDVWTALRSATDLAVSIPTHYADRQGALLAALSPAVDATLPGTSP